MKYLFTLFFIILFSCNSKSDRNIETEPETAECPIGKWVPEDADQMPYNEYNFTADIKGNRIENTQFQLRAVNKSGEEREVSGDWIVTSTGNVKAYFLATRVISIRLINCNRFVARGERVYIKQ